MTAPPPVHASATAPRLAAGGFALLAGLHLVWATGSTWPAADAGAISGRPATASPGPLACVAVAGLLSAAAALVTGHPRGRPALARAGSAGVTATFTLRGAFGLAGRTDLLSPGSTSPRFRELDRRYYAPLCLTLAALSAPAVRPARSAWLRDRP
jgi:uncharacterized protein DUF3995